MSAAYLNAGARLSECGTYRYALSRRWAPEGTRACFVMLNPSTADEQQDDPTIRKCVGFAKRWGHSALVVVNLFAFRATDPSELPKAAEPVGVENDASIAAVVQLASVVVAAWGTKGTLRGRAEAVVELVTQHADLHALRITKGGQPEHPLYLPGELAPQPWKARRAPSNEAAKPEPRPWPAVVVPPLWCPCGQRRTSCPECGRCQATAHARCEHGWLP